MMKYCEKCQRVFDEAQRCPECGKPGDREAAASDSCFLLSTGQIWADMILDVFKQNDIPFLKQGRMGAGMAMITGIPLETYSIFVPFSYYDQAREIADSIVPEDGLETPDDQEFDFDPSMEHEEEEP
jgi:hypothetical protein